MSSRASRDRVNCRPSKHISTPAAPPSRVEPVRRRTRRMITSTMSVPTTALGKRHPSGSKPKTCSPAPMSHLPTSGWTTMAGSPWVMSGVRRPSRTASLASSRQLIP